MDFTLEQLEKKVTETLKDGKVNNFIFRGYPILHVVAMELGDESDHSKHACYLNLIETILAHPDCNPDILDIHGKSSLICAAEGGNLALVNLLLRYKADPNLIDRAKEETALEYAIHNNPTSPVVRVLLSKTVLTKKMSENFEELFKTAIEEKNVDWINVLLDLGLVRYHKRLGSKIANASGVPEAFWMRVIIDPKKEKEKEILEKRERYIDAGLAGLRHKEITRDPDPNYTPYSPCTLVRQGIPISLYNASGEAALMIRPTSDPIAYWHDGQREQLTNEMDYHEGSHLTHGRGVSGQYHEVTPEQIGSIVQKLYEEEIRKYEQEAVEEPDQYDKHGVLLDERLSKELHWNEGLLRYKRKQIFGIHIDPTNKESVLNGLKLKKILNLDVPFYYYNPCLGNSQLLNIDIVLMELGVSSRVASPVVEPMLLSGGPAREARSIPSGASAVTEYIPTGAAATAFVSRTPSITRGRDVIGSRTTGGEEERKLPIKPT